MDCIIVLDYSDTIAFLMDFIEISSKLHQYVLSDYNIAVIYFTMWDFSLK